jgi:SAM-dependent methyltransferase
MALNEEVSGTGASGPGRNLEEEIRRFWDADAPTYDDSSSHRPRDPAVLAAWTAALAHLLPPAPVRVLDVGAGTGFLSLIAARLGHTVTALDLSPQMLSRLQRVARAEDLEIEVVTSPAARPPEGFDVVMERHVLWTLSDPADALGSCSERAAGVVRERVGKRGLSQGAAISRSPSASKTTKRALRPSRQLLRLPASVVAARFRNAAYSVGTDGGCGRLAPSTTRTPTRHRVG